MPRRRKTMSHSAEWVSLGRRIRAERKARGLGLVELGRAAGCSHPFLSQVENGKALPSLPSLFDIAAALHVTPAELLTPSSLTPTTGTRDG